MRLDLVDIFLLIRILPCANAKVDEQFRQTTLLTGEDSSIRLSFLKRENDSITLTNFCNPQLFICLSKQVVFQNSHRSQNLVNDGNLIKLM